MKYGRHQEDAHEPIARLCRQLQALLANKTLYPKGQQVRDSASVTSIEHVMCKLLQLPSCLI